MKAAVVHQFRAPLSVEDVPVPEPGPEQVLVRVEASGLCHTDVHAAHGDWPVKPEPPFVPGHEAVGIVERLGEGNAHGLEVGMRVAVPWLGYACGDCRFCNSGRETLCEAQQNTGYSVDGGFAEYVVGWARHVVLVPDGVDPADAAPLTCAGVTTYKAVKESGCTSASRIAVFGVGGLGHMAVQYARITGAEVIAVDLNDARLETARELGASHTINPRTQDPVAAIQALGGADAAIATAVSPKAFEQALGSLARGGTLVCVGLPADNEMGLPIFETVLGGLTVKGSIVGTHQDLVEVFALHRRGLTRVERSEVALEDVNEAIAAMLDGSAGTARTVFRIAPDATTDQSAPAAAGAAS
ncbi:zinc-dependent alcohol dehydrogenase [Patulibacter americanus]|uniref:zinc-dependent alcohol dehydrogenase n=1 Tax=Patulibacter americanus TaxID=588672 RepID=UPI0003B3C2EC|nr:zinc-dependent alcohol dehydrogenase [Patulibacter americanus]